MTHLHLVTDDGLVPPPAALALPGRTFSKRDWSTFLRHVAEVQAAKGKPVTLSVGAIREIADHLELGDTSHDA